MVKTIPETRGIKPEEEILPMAALRHFRVNGKEKMVIRKQHIQLNYYCPPNIVHPERGK